MEPWTRQLLSIVVSQVCKTIGWHSISTTCLQILVDVLHRYLKQMGTNIQEYTEHFNHTFPALEEVNLAFIEMGINVDDLREYVEYVSPLPLPKTKVPKYPLEKKSNLNFLKPGSREVVTRPVHIHEHLPAMYPELTEENYSTPEPLADEKSLPSLSSSTSSSTSMFMKPNDNEVINKRLTQLISEEIGREVRKLTSVMMTSSGFLSPMREGKAPETQTPKLSLLTNHVVTAPPTPAPPSNVPPEVSKSEHKTKSAHKLNNVKSSDRKNRDDHHHHSAKDDDDVKVKKSSNKEANKHKALKQALNKPVESESPKSHPEKSRKATPPSSPKDPVKPPKPAKMEKLPEKVPEPEIVAEEKLTTEPNKQKLNIFKRISKVKEERAESPVPKVSTEKNAQILECIDAVVKRSRDVKEDPDANVFREEKAKPVAFEKPSPEPVPEVTSTKHTKRKKKQKPQHGCPPVKKFKENSELRIEIEKIKPKSVHIEAEHEVPMYSIMSNLHRPGIIPPSLMQNPLLPRFPNPFMSMTRLEANGLHPEMPNLPLPPPGLMHANMDNHMSPTPKVQQEPVKSEDVSLSIVIDRKQKKKMKKDKREKEKKKRDKKDKLKSKEKSEKKKEKVLKKIKVKNKDKVKKGKKLNAKKEEVSVTEDPSVPKLKLKLGSTSSPQMSPSGTQSPKIVIKPIIKHDEVVKSPIESHVIKEEREPSPELAKISALTSKPMKQKSQSKSAPEPTNNTSVKQTVEPIIIPTKSKKNSSISEVKHKNKDKPSKHKKGTGEEQKAKPAAFYYDAEGNQVWVCPACGAQDDGSPMIGCDGCDAWYHWVCVGIKSAPDSAKWFCVSCAKA